MNALRGPFAVLCVGALVGCGRERPVPRDDKAVAPARRQAWAAECRPPLPSVARIEGVRADSACALVGMALEAVRGGRADMRIDSTSLLAVVDATLLSVPMGERVAREMGFHSTTQWVVRLRRPSEPYDLEAWIDPGDHGSVVQWAHRGLDPVARERPDSAAP